MEFILFALGYMLYHGIFLGVDSVYWVLDTDDL
jgi:hypothetical protein